MPRWFKLYALALIVWAWWAVERIDARHAEAKNWRIGESR